LAVNTEMDKSLAHRKVEKWPSYLETIDKPWNSPGETFFYIEQII